MKKAIFTGSISGGFRLECVVEDVVAAEAIVTTRRMDGQFAEAVDVTPPVR